MTVRGGVEQKSARGQRPPPSLRLVRVNGFPGVLVLWAMCQLGMQPTPPILAFGCMASQLLPPSQLRQIT